MRHSSIFSILLLGAVMVALAGCDPTLNLGDRKVIFSASSKGTPTTKTVYGTPVTSGIQSINWTGDDKIRIYSPDTNVYVQNSDPTQPNGSWKPTDESFELDYWYADYKLVPLSNPSQASLENVGGNGLAWLGSGTATFYAAYPFNTPISATLPDAEGKSYLRLAVQVPASQTGAATNVKDMPMIAIQPNVSSGSEVSLDFYPAFSAFEFHLKSADNQSLTLNSFTLSSGTTSEPLTGYCHYDLNKLSDPDNRVAAEGYDSHYLKNTWLSFDNKGNTIEIPLSQTVNSSDEAVFTLFTLPCALSNLSISVTFTPEGGSQMTKTLKLEYADHSPLTFKAGHKARITGLALEAGVQWNFKIQLDDETLPWELITESTTFSQNIQSTRFDISNAKEAADENNYYPSGTRDYQVRTLDMDNGKTFFVVTFRPMAPMGGYWRLFPESNGGNGTAAFKIEVWDPDEGIGSPDLTGQIMNQTVTLHISCNVTDEERDRDHAIILKGLFSTSINFDENSTYSADSELQDTHKDGSFSYWRFVIPAKNN